MSMPIVQAVGVLKVEHVSNVYRIVSVFGVRLITCVCFINWILYLMAQIVSSVHLEPSMYRVSRARLHYHKSKTSAMIFNDISI